MDATSAAALISAIAGLLTAVALLVSVLHNGRGIGQANDQLRTANDLTLGRASDQAETRRVDEMPEEHRTEEERQHLADVPPVTRPDDVPPPSV